MDIGLKQSNSDYLMALSVKSGVVRLDSQFSIIAIDAEIETLIKQNVSMQNQDVFVGQQWQDIVMSLQGSLGGEPWREVCKTNSDQTALMRSVTKTEEPFELIIRYSPVFDSHNKLIELLIFIVVSDATPQLEKDLQIEKSYYRAMVEDMPALVYRYTLDGTVTLANDEMGGYLGANSEDLIGMSIYDIMDAENVDRAKKHLANITPENPIATHEHNGTDKDGRIRWYQWTDRLVLSDEGAPLGYQGIGLDLTDRKKHEEELFHLASTDALTGLLNRYQCLTLGKKELVRCNRYGRSFSLLIIDIDFFKKVNDVYGHIAGDKVLQVFAKLCPKVLRDSDVIGRFGGEEFIIILPEANLKEANLTAERLRKDVELMEIPFEGHSIKITISIGIATIADNTETSLDTLLARADKALYQAKATGRNKIICWDETADMS